VAWSLVLCRHCTPLCTLADRLEDGSRSGESNDGGLQNGEVGRRTLMSQVVRKSFGGRVNLGGDKCSGVILHRNVAGSDCSWLATGAADLSMRGGSLAITRFSNSVTWNWFSIRRMPKIGVLGSRRSSLYLSKRNLTLVKGYCASPLLLIPLLSPCLFSAREKARGSRCSRESCAPWRM